MPGALGPRFVLEAGFLILLAVVLGLADLSPLLIIVIMALAWALVSLIEYFAWRQGPRYPARYAAAVGMIEEEQVVEQPAPVPPPPVTRPEADVPPPAEEQTVVASAPGGAPPDEVEAPAAGSSEESVEQAEARVDAARLAFSETQRRTRHRLEPLQPLPRRRWWIFGPRTRPGESPREEER